MVYHQKRKTSMENGTPGDSWVSESPRQHAMLSLYMALASTVTLNPLIAKLLNLNFHPLEVVSR